MHKPYPAAHAALDITEQGLKWVEMAPRVSFTDLQAATGCQILR